MKEGLAHMEKMASEAERFSAMGVFTVDRSTILALLSTIVTYLIIVLQSK